MAGGRAAVRPEPLWVATVPANGGLAEGSRGRDLRGFREPGRTQWQHMGGPPNAPLTGGRTHASGSAQGRTGILPLAARKQLVQVGDSPFRRVCQSILTAKTTGLADAQVGLVTPMMIHEKKQDDASTKELRVQLPVDYVIKLRMLKILRGTDMRDLVKYALDMYFAEARAEQTKNAIIG